MICCVANKMYKSATQVKPGVVIQPGSKITFTCYIARYSCVMKMKFNWRWYLLLALALTTIVCIIHPLIDVIEMSFRSSMYKNFSSKGFIHNLVLSFIIAIPLSLILKADKLNK